MILPYSPACGGVIRSQHRSPIRISKIVLVLVVVLPTSPRRLKLREAMSGRLSSKKAFPPCAFERRRSVFLRDNLKAGHVSRPNNLRGRDIEDEDVWASPSLHCDGTANYGAGTS
jgi:hypothetical protein